MDKLIKDHIKTTRIVNQRRLDFYRGLAVVCSTLCTSVVVLNMLSNTHNHVVSGAALIFGILYLGHVIDKCKETIIV